MPKTETTFEILDEAIVSDKWTNIFFLKDGRSFVSPYVLPTEADALKHALQSEKILTPHGSHTTACGITFNDKDYSYAIQVPA